VPPRVVLGLHGEGPLLGHGPHEAGQFAGNGPGDYLGVFASCHAASVPFTQSPLGLPTAVLDDFGLFFQA
jgi:hypothetical protein